MKIYLSAGCDMHKYNAVLTGLGHDVTVGVEYEAENFVTHDLENLKRSDMVILFTDYESFKFEQLARLGAALVLGIRCILIGKEGTLFHWLPQVEHYEDALVLFAVLSREATSK